MMKRLLSLLAPALCAIPLLSAADSSMEITTNIINPSCQISLDNEGSVDLGTVNQDYFANNETPEDYLAGGKSFYIQVNNCAPVGGKTPTQITFQFAPLSGSFSPYSGQIFANEDKTGPDNVGVVIFSTHDQQNIFNVLNTDGTPRSIYDVTPADYTDANYTFYARMQKVVASRSVTGGAVKASVLVSVYYE
ncbi:fimbrial-like protein [Kluyvera georgiana]|uniref:fimbrial-like protein n=1 Tax=Kluyvera georgiana TaxID=73098 RepID=UPI00322009DC